MLTSKFLKYFFFFLAAFWWCFLIQSASRGAILCLLIAPLIALIIFKNKSHTYIKKYLAAFGAGIDLKFLLFNTISSVHNNTVIKSLSSRTGRLNRWKEMSFDIIEKPLLGYGPMSFAEIGKYTAGHPHNAVMQFGYEFGIPALLIALALVFWALQRWGVFATNEKDLSGFAKPDRSIPIKIGITTSLLAGAGYSLFSGVIVMPLSQLWMVLVGGWALGIYLNSKQQKTNSKETSKLKYQKIKKGCLLWL